MEIIGIAEVECLSCQKKVTVEVQRYGRGHLAICPECSKLAYNSKEPPKGMKKQKK